LENEDEKAARRDFINDVTQEAYRLKRLLGLISLPKTPEELAKAVERFKRHADTAERRHAAGAYRTLLAGIEDHDESDDFQSNSIASTAPNDAFMAEDSYETNTME
jgi:putative transposase